MLMLITEMLITQGVTNMPYKSPHPRHTERNRMGGGGTHTSPTQTQTYADGSSTITTGRQEAQLVGDQLSGAFGCGSVMSGWTLTG